MPHSCTPTIRIYLWLNNHSARPTIYLKAGLPFLTLGISFPLCTKDRQQELTKAQNAETIRTTWRRQHRDHDYTFHCGTVMPDHVHWLCSLGERVTLAQIISKFKSLAKVSRSWQRNYYDHRLRADDAKEPFSKYIFLNPYRKTPTGRVCLV